MTQTNDMAAELIDNRHLRFDATVRATVKLRSVPAKVDTIVSIPHRPTAELFVPPHKKRLLATHHTQTQKSEISYPLRVIFNGHSAEPIRVPDELLSVSSPLLAEEELPETVRLFRPLRLKEQPPTRHVEKVRKEIPPKTCDFRVRRIPMPPQLRFADPDVPTSEVEKVLRPIFADTSSERMPVLPFVTKPNKMSGHSSLSMSTPSTTAK